MDQGGAPGRDDGFTLVELLVVVLIIGILSAIAVPQYFRAVEKSKAAEALNYLTALKSAQDNHLSRTGMYATHVTMLEINIAAMRNFVNASAATSAGVMGVAPATANPPSWWISVYRAGTPPLYGNYQLQYTGPIGSMSCNNTACANDLLP